MSLWLKCIWLSISGIIANAIINHILLFKMQMTNRKEKHKIILTGTTKNFSEGNTHTQDEGK